ncbi:hypothetical protein C6P40_000974 [Pichia californica]|uniref:Alcohol acetyltransferase n=1 Tax=Pichia californica TaxID=460514 RepID=A0A9P7BF14_9ASCO|nr:hypothetical protein C6P40_000974 [[Candida] californica]
MNTKTRDFTPFEKYYFWRNKLNMYSNFRVAVEYSEELNIESIFYSLSSMVSQHSSLSMNAYPKDTLSFFHFQYKLGLMQSYKLSDVLEVIDDDNLSIEDIFNQLQNVHFYYGTSKPLWSLILLNKKTLIYYSDHLLFDGSSGLNFHKIFSQSLNQNKNEKEGRIQFNGINTELFNIDKIDNDDFQIPPKPTDLIDYSVPFCYLMYVIMLICFPKSLSNIIKYFFIDDANISKSKTYNTIALSKKMIDYNDSNSEKTKDNCKLVHISQSKLQQLILDCRKYNVKLTSLLVVMSLLSISKITGNQKDTMVVIPVNSRSKIDEDKQNKTDFGLYLGDLNLELPPVQKMCHNGKINWNFVRYINDYIHGSIKNSQRDLGLVSWIDSKIFLQERQKCHENSMIGTLLVSNLGNLKDSNNYFENAYFDQPCKSGVLSLFSMNVISTTKGGAHLSLHSVNKKWLDIFNEGVNQQLSEF